LELADIAETGVRRLLERGDKVRERGLPLFKVTSNC